jgi:chaperonin GroES
MMVQPLDDRILVEVQEEEIQKVGSIIIPDTAKEKPRIGVVHEVGTDEDLKENIKKGDKVFYSKYAGDEISIDGKDYLFIQRGDILGIIKD